MVEHYIKEIEKALAALAQTIERTKDAADRASLILCRDRGAVLQGMLVDVQRENVPKDVETGSLHIAAAEYVGAVKTFNKE